MIQVIVSDYFQEQNSVLIAVADGYGEEGTKLILQKGNLKNETLKCYEKKEYPQLMLFSILIYFANKKEEKCAKNHRQCTEYPCSQDVCI